MLSQSGSRTAFFRFYRKSAILLFGGEASLCNLRATILSEEVSGKRPEQVSKVDF